MMQMKKEPDSQDNTRPNDLNKFKFHLCICEKPINFVFLQMYCGCLRFVETKRWYDRLQRQLLIGKS